MRRLGSATRSPNGTAINAPTRIAAHAGKPASAARRAVANAPMPARVIWQSEIIPPSPVTIVYDRKTIASATPCANTPIQNWSKIQKLLNSTGSSVRTMAAITGPINRRKPCAGGSGGASPWAPPPTRRSISNDSRRRPDEVKL